MNKPYCYGCDGSDAVAGADHMHQYINERGPMTYIEFLERALQPQYAGWRDQYKAILTVLGIDPDGQVERRVPMVLNFDYHNLAGHVDIGPDGSAVITVIDPRIVSALARHDVVTASLDVFPVAEKTTPIIGTTEQGVIS